MPQLLIRNLEDETIQRLKTLAKSHNRSLQGEVKLILEEVARQPDELPLAIAERWQGYFAGRSFSDCTEQVRQGRIMIDLLSAGNDPLFMADVVEIQQAFEHTDHEKAL